MAAIALRTSRVSLYGRVADEFTRNDVRPDEFQASINDPFQEALRKGDGHFVFADVPDFATSVTVTLEGPAYRPRSLSATLVPGTPVALAPAGEDELFLSITGVNPSDKQVTFDTIPFLPSIAAEAPVLGPGGFTATLTEPLEGSDIVFAALSDVTGLSPDDVLRVVRSSRIVMRSGPYYPFPSETTLVAFTVVEDDPDAAPIADAAVTITNVNDEALQTVTIDGVALRRIPLTSGSFLLLGTDAAIETVTNERGLAVFFYESHLSADEHPVMISSVEKLEVTISKGGYVPETRAFNVTTAERTTVSVTLIRA